MPGFVVSNPIGKGLRFESIRSVWITRGGAAVFGGTYMLAEDVVTDDAAVTLENSGKDEGSLSNVVVPSAAAVAGLTNAAAAELAMFVLCQEAAADDQPFFGCVEGYYVDAIVTTTATRQPRSALFPRTNADLHETRGGIGSPAIARLVTEAAAATTLRKVHFCGLPGGFGNGPGTT